jgi:hypothetical protein
MLQRLASVTTGRSWTGFLAVSGDILPEETLQDRLRVYAHTELETDP